MRYAFSRGPTTVVVGAAETIVDLETWYESVRGTNNGYEKDKATSFMDHLRDPDLKGYKHPAYVFDFANEVQRDAFLSDNSVKLVSTGLVKDYHDDMIAEKRGAMGYSETDLADRRTLEEMHGLDKNDRWDRRSDKEKAHAEEGKRQMDEMKKRVGEAVTGSSFDPNPRGSNDGTFNVNRISDGNSGISVTATKRAGVTTEPVQAGKELVSKALNRVEVLKEYGIDETMPVGEVLDKLSEQLTQAGFQADKIDIWRQRIESQTDINPTEVAVTVRTTIVNRKLQIALSPVKGANSVEEALETIRERLDEISELTDEQREQIFGSARDNLLAPKPQPGDYKFAVSDKLTASPAMCGAGTPIIHVSVNKDGPSGGTFTLHDGMPLLEALGLSHVSSDLFAYEVQEDAPTYTADIRQTLIDAGFVEDNSVIPTPVKPSRNKDSSRLTPSDFTKALAGDGTSAVDGTGSYGRHKIGKAEADYIDDMKPGLVGDKGVELDQDAMLERKAWGDINNILREKLETVMKGPSTVLVGRYAGVQLGDGNYVLAIGPNEKLLDHACINVRHLGATRLADGSTAIVVARDQRIAWGVVVVESQEDLKIYILS